MVSVHAFRKFYTAAASHIRWFLVLFLILFKNAYYLFSYYPIADDNNMYGVYRLSSNIFEDVILHYKLYSVRPALAVIDTFLISRLWDRLGLALFIMTILLFLCAFLLYKIFQALDLRIGLAALAIFALLPFGNEATYWISASSRLVTGLFFLLLSFYLLCLTLDKGINPKGKRLSWVLFLIIHLISLCFYEQIITMSFIALTAIALYKWKSLRPKWGLALAYLNYGLIALWYWAFSNVGNVAARGRLAAGDLGGNVLKVSGSILDLWMSNLREFIHTGIGKSFEIILTDGAYWYLLSAALLCAVLPSAFSPAGAGIGNKKKAALLLTGLMLFIAPCIPFFLLENAWIATRNIFLSFIGLGMMIEAILSMLFDHNRVTLAAKKVLIGGMVFILLTANVYELDYYRKVALKDREIISEVASNARSDDYFNGNKGLLLFNTRTNYTMDTYNRMGNCTGADWALTGALEAWSGRKQLKMASPIPAGAYVALNKKGLDSSVLMGMDESMSVIPLAIGKKSGNQFILSTIAGNEFGEVELYENGTALFIPR